MPFISLAGSEGGDGGIGGLTLPFRGDWQVPTEMLLFSAAFEGESPEDYFLQEPENSTLSRRAKSAGAAGSFTWEMYWRKSVASTQLLLFKMAEMGLVGNYISSIKFWIRAERSGSTTLNIGMSRTGVSGTGILSDVPRDTFGGTAWAEITIDHNALAPDSIGFYSAGGVSSVMITGFRVYGQNVSDLYSTGDVVVHDGFYWRSLFNGNSEEPGVGDKWASFSIPT